MRLSSREYQHRLSPNLFANGNADVSRFLEFVSGLHPRVRLAAGATESTSFTRELLDTDEGSFSSRGLKLRLRKYQSRWMACYKAVALDRYLVKRARVETAPEYALDAVTKFEEGIYALHSAFSTQTSVPVPVGWGFERVADWSRIFPGAREIAPDDKPLHVTARRVIQKTHKVQLDFEGFVADAMLEVGFEPGSLVPETADFSWKYRRKKGRFLTGPISLMRAFSQALNQSTWADPDVHLRKALTDAGATWSSEVLEGFFRRRVEAPSLSPTGTDSSSLGMGPGRHMP
jgi:hypothetical protein